MSIMKNIKAAGTIIAVALLVMTFTAQPVAAASRYDSLLAFISDSYDIAEGGYAYYDETTSRSDASFAAAGILTEWGILDDRPPVINITKLKQLTFKLHWRTGTEDLDRYGGFSHYIAGPVTQRTTFDVISILDILDNPEHQDVININDPDIQVNFTAVLVWLNKTQTDSGGFGSEPEKPADVLSTFYALTSMDYALDVVDDAEETWDKWLMNRTATIEYILSAREGDAFKLSPESHVTSATATAAAVLALNSLEEISQIGDLQPIVDWVIDRQTTSEEDELAGGFEESILTNDTNLITTYWALTMLDTVNAMAGVNASSAARFIVNCQSEDGAFALVPGASDGLLYTAYQAVRSLNILGEEYSNLIHEGDPNNPDAILIDWRVIVVVGIILAAAIMAIVALRYD
jgi:prenyltransferase beta subunit